MTNYIVSGLERSGTSMMMQILNRAGVPIAYDNSRKPDENNELGYYELYEGKIIDNIKNIDFDDYKEKFIKVTSIGLEFLPEDGRKYKIIFMVRDIEEIIESSKKFSGKFEEYSYMKEILRKLMYKLIDDMNNRKDIEYVLINHHSLIECPEQEILKVNDLLGLDVSDGIKAIKKDMWHCRNTEVV